MPKKQSKRFKHKTRKSAKYNPVKRFKPADVRFREKREAAVEKEAENRYRYHELRLRYQGRS